MQPQGTAHVGYFQPAGSLPTNLSKFVQNITSGFKPAIDPYAALNAKYANQDQQTKNLLASLNSLNKQVYAPTPDIAGINANARAAAEANVNPYYTKQLNDFLAKQAIQKQIQEKQTQMNIQNIQDTLKNTLEQNKITQGRTAEDVAQNIGDINTQSSEFQTDSGQAFNNERLDLARTASTGGLGQQQLEASQTNRNIQEGRQGRAFQLQRQQQELYKARTFEDLGRAGELAKTSAEKGKKQAEFDLSTYIQNQTFELQDKQQQLELERQAKLAQEIAAQVKGGYIDFFNKISNPAQKQAFAQAYGGYL